MRRQVITAYCDMCNTALDKEVEAVTSVSYVISNPTHRLNPSSIKTNHVLDLCEEHAGMLMKILDIGQSIKPSPIMGTSKKAKRDKNRIVCKWCDGHYIPGPGFTLHAKRHHPEVDKEELWRYIEEVRINQLGREEQEQ